MDHFLNNIKWKSETGPKSDVFIQCEGLGSNFEYKCFNYPKQLSPPANPPPPTTKIIYFNYASKGLLHDALTLVRDLKQPDGNLITRKERLDSLVSLIRTYITNRNVAKVGLLGISHGSLLMHAAIVRLKCDITLTREDLNKLHLYTIGSPKYPHPNLLIAFEEQHLKHVNFYHKLDEKVQQVRFLFGARHHARHFATGNISYQQYPNDSQTNTIFDINIARRIIVHMQPSEFIRNGHDVMYHASQYMLYPLFESRTNTGNNGYNVRNNVQNGNIAFYKGSLCYPLFWAAYFDKMPSLGDKCDLPALEGGGAPKKAVVFNKKQYVVKTDKSSKKKYITVKRAKVFLKDIKGKYKYT
jgi:hypothetical protein